MKETLRKEILAITTIEEWKEATELMGRLLTHLKLVAATKFHIGDKVFFIHNGEKILGTVKKVNSVTIKVVTEKRGQWRVSPTLLHKQ